MTIVNKNLVWQEAVVSSEQRIAVAGQKGVVIWFTGLSGSGKSTVARSLEKRLMDQGHLAYLLDGDNIRHGLNKDLGFSTADRSENIRRIAEVAHLFADSGVICLAAFISPLIEMRAMAQRIVGAERFIEVAVDTPLDVCEQRDPKKLYARARAGEIEDFTGISAPYEVPVSPNIVLKTHEISVNDAVDCVWAYLEKSSILAVNGPT